MTRYALRRLVGILPTLLRDRHGGVLPDATRAGRTVRRGADRAAGDRGEPAGRVRARPAGPRAVPQLPRGPAAWRPRAFVPHEGLQRRRTDRARSAGDADDRRRRARARAAARRAARPACGTQAQRMDRPRRDGHRTCWHRGAEFRRGAGAGARIRRPARLAACRRLGAGQPAPRAAARRHARAAVRRLHRATDARQPARGAAVAVHPHGPGQGPLRAVRSCAGMR